MLNHRRHILLEVSQSQHRADNACFLAADYLADRTYCSLRSRRRNNAHVHFRRSQTFT
jgi:hypothetical protein